MADKINELAQYPMDELVSEIARRASGKMILYAETEKQGRDDPSQSCIYLSRDCVWALGASRVLDIHIDAMYQDAYISGGEDTTEDKND